MTWCYRSTAKSDVYLILKIGGLTIVSLLWQSGLAQTDEEGSFAQETDFLRPPNTVGPQVGNAR
jgi:hypothetical protein